ncbi:MAG TPA: HAMP domain-containing sensor histidine kinase [Myxococcota bacterium]
MKAPPLDPKQQRTQTDESLQAERTKSDQVIAEHQADVANDEDQVVQRARHQADVVLAAAREKADDAGGRTRPAHALVEERRQEDAILRAERRAADVVRRRERAALNAMLPLDREKTDLYLLTERARSDDALANRDDFMGMVSHDLRNLLNSVALQAAVAAELAPVDDAGRRIVATMAQIRSSVGRMNRLIGDLVDIASIDAGSLALHREEADVVAIAHEAVDVLTGIARQRGVQLELRGPQTPVVAEFDEGRVLQVLDNLLNNALKFTPAGGAVVVEVCAADDHVAVTVGDTGVGIASEQLERIFERFAQVGHDRRGLGLGLYISRCIVDAHGGRLHATSEVGVGSTLHVTLPRKTSGDAARSPM